MNRILIIAKNTFTQAIRDRILYGIIVFALIFIGSTVALSSLSLGEDIFVIRNLGLAGIYIFSLIITIFLGASIVYEEVEKKTAYLLLAKPVTRGDIIIGKFLGLLCAISLTTLLLFGTYLLVVILNGGTLDYIAFWSIILQLFEMGILIGILILFSTLTTPLAAIIYTLLILYMGHLLSLLKEYASKSDLAFKYILTGVYYIFPNLEKFNIRNLIVHQIPLQPQEIVISAGYAFVYIALTLYLARALLNRKEL